MAEFLSASPTLEDNWRAVILFGKNSATYKFALGQALLSLGKAPNDLVRLDELALPYAKGICEHMRETPRQGTSGSSTFLQECQRWLNNEYTEEQLRDATVKYGFKNVITAFHNLGVNQESVRFFHDERKNAHGIRLTSEFFELVNTNIASDLSHEVESRWRLVETAWRTDVSVRLIETDATNEKLVALFDLQEGQPIGPRAFRRVSVTSSRDALNGYQKGFCFHCFTQIGITPGTPDLAHVDHVFPHALAPKLLGRNLNGIWNLVLACRTCNGAKSNYVPHLDLVERLHRRNEFLIKSKHPLGETIALQTGDLEIERKRYLQKVHDDALAARVAIWMPILRGAPRF